MTTLCIVTAVHKGHPSWLKELGESISDLQLPSHVEVVWAVQQDGPASRDVARVVERYPFAAYGWNGRAPGVAVTRNVALSRVGQADLVTNIDCDDLLAPGFAASVDELATSPNVVWAQGAVQDLHQDGSTTDVTPSITGWCDPGKVPDAWAATGKLPIHTVGFLARADHWRAMGGWVAGPTMSDDTNAVISLCAAYPGVVHNEVVARWRRHSGQASMNRSHLESRNAAWEIVRQRRESIVRLAARGDGVPSPVTVAD
jgi:hypothetical protein